MTQIKKLPVYNFDMIPKIWSRKEMRKMSGNAWKVLSIVGTFTIGFQRREAKISYSLLEDYTGMCRKTCIRAAKELVELGLILHEVIDGISVYKVIFEDDTDTEQLEEAYKREKKLVESNSETEASVNSTLEDTQEIITSVNSTLVKGGGSVNSTLEGSVKNAHNIQNGFLNKKTAIYNGHAGFLDKIYFDYDTNNFVGTEELNKYVVDEYLERIQNFGLDGQEIYNKACVDFVRRKNTRHEVKKAGIWLLSLFRDASFGDVYKYGATSQVEKNNFKVNYELYCSFPHFRDFRLEQRRFLIVKGKEYSFYSSPEIFREAFKDYEV